MPHESEKKAVGVVRQKNTIHKVQIDFFSGLFSGVTCAVLFHP
jgi:hypothetical protein